MGKKGIPSLVLVKLGAEEYPNLPKTHSTLIAKRKNPELMHARLFARGDEIRGCTEYDTSSPTSTRMSSKAVIFLASVMRWKIGVADISQAFPQADLIIPSQRVVVIAPWFIPTPWHGRVGLSRDKYTKPTWGWLTMRPLYGTKCAPLWWFRKLSSCFLQNQWSDCTLDPCVYRWGNGNATEGLAVLHVDDILVTGADAGFTAFEKVI